MTQQPNVPLKLTLGSIALGAALGVLAACGLPELRDATAATLTPAERAFEQGVQDRFHRFARFTHAGPHARELTVGKPWQPGASRPLADALAQRAFASALRPGDTLRVILRAPRRIGPLAFGGSAQRFTFSAAPSPASSTPSLP